MTLKHTAGPWIAGDDEDSDYFLVGPASFDRVVCHPVVKLHNQADAYLIAAAPELLNALRIAVHQNSHDMLMTGDEIRICEAAINKATGE